MELQAYPSCRPQCLRNLHLLLGRALELGRRILKDHMRTRISCCYARFTKEAEAEGVMISGTTPPVNHAHLYTSPSGAA